MIKAVIFDMDGTMIATESLWKEINTELAEKYHAIFNPEIRRKMMGRNDFDSLTAFKEYNRLTVPVEELIQTRRKILLDNIHKATANPGLYELLELLGKMNIKKAMATSAFRAYADRVLKDYKLESEFEAVVTGDDVKESKPNPEIFLKAAAAIHIDPVDCLVIEDAQNGVEAGYNAGMKVIAVPHEHSMHHDFSKADKVVNSLAEITEDVIKRI